MDDFRPLTNLKQQQKGEINKGCDNQGATCIASLLAISKTSFPWCCVASERLWLINDSACPQPQTAAKEAIDKGYCNWEATGIISLLARSNANIPMFYASGERLTLLLNDSGRR